MPYYVMRAARKNRTPTSQLSGLERNQRAVANALQKLEEEGLLDDFLKYSKNDSIFDKLKTLGLGALDVISRTGYVTAGAIEEGLEGKPENIPARVGRELFSGIGNIQGDKKFLSDVTKKFNPEYAQFSEEHPIASIPIDLAMDIGGDVGSFIPAKYFGKVAGGIGKGASAVSKQLNKIDAYQNIAGTLGKTFIPGYAWKKSGASLGYDIIWSEGKIMQNLRNNLHKEMLPSLEKITDWASDEHKTLIKLMYGDDLPKMAKKTTNMTAHKLLNDYVKTNWGEKIGDVYEGLSNAQFKIGRREAHYNLLKTMRLNYFPNNAKKLTEFAENIGEYTTSGMNRGLKMLKQVSDREKIFQTGDEFLNWLEQIGVPDDKLGDVITTLLLGRADESIQKMKALRINTKLIKELPDVIEPVPWGTKKVWSLAPKDMKLDTGLFDDVGNPIIKNIKKGDPLVKPGNTLYMPKGNLRFFKTNIKNIISEKAYKILEEGGIVTDDIMDELNNLINKKTFESRGALKMLEEHVIKSSETAEEFIENLKLSYNKIDKNIIKKYIKALYTYAKKADSPVPKSISKELSTFILSDLFEKTIISVSSKVKAYQVPQEIVQDLDKISVRLVNVTEAFDWWDKAMNYFKNTAIFSPFFHNRNMIESMSKNYIARMDFNRYGDIIPVLLPNTDKNKVIQGLTVATWRYQLNKYGGLGGSLVGQTTREVGLPGVKQVFNANRWIGRNIEDINRGALFMDTVIKNRKTLKGNKLYLEAGKRVKKWHFDYGELTDAEREIARRVIPFYAWCVSEDTECLTYKGWKKHDDVNIDDIILTYNINKKELEWQPVLDKFESYYNYKLLNFKGKSIDLLCTFDHNCVTNEGLIRAYKVAQNNTVSMNIKYNKEDYPITDKILKIISWIITDGYSRNRKNFWELMIYQKKEPYLTEIKNLIEKDYSISIHPDSNTSCIRINGETRKEILKYFDGKDNIWDLFIQLSPRQLKIAQDEMMKAEGNIGYKHTGKEFKCFSQKDGIVKDVFQLITILSGTISNMSKRGIFLRNKKTVKYPPHKIVDYKGIIWCPTTKNETWLSRRNGKVIVTGNTRHNIPLLLEQLVKAPDKFRNIAKLKRSMIGGIESKDNPDWWKQQDVWETKFGLALQVGLSYTDLLSLMENPTGMSGPAGTIGNILRNYDPFYNKKIKEFKGQTEPILTIGNTKIRIPAKFKYAIENFLPIYKRYGSDLSQEITDYLTETDDVKRKAKFDLIGKFTGIKIIPQLKTEKEKSQVYRLLNSLREYNDYKKQEENKTLPFVYGGEE